MKIRNIFAITLAASLALVSACTETDMSKYDEWLGEKFNQEILWDVDSMAFRRADWKGVEIAGGAQVRASEVKMWETVQKISYITFSPNMFNTYLGYSETEATVGDIAASYEDALFAINAGDLVDGKPANFFKLDGKVINAANSSEEADGLVGLVSSPIGVTARISKNIAETSEYSSAMVAGPVLVYNGKEQIDSTHTGEFYQTRMARTIFGVSSTGNYVMGVIDGGVSGKADGATVQEAAFIARMMGMQNAILLGSGDASTLWSSDKGVINAPSAGSAQKVGTIIYVGEGTARVTGEGTEASPYLIENHVHMTQMRTLCKPATTTYFKMMEDVDMSPVKMWTPVNFDGSFDRQVIFDGNNKTISNFAPGLFVQDDQSTAASYPSIFGVMYGTCKDLTIKNAKIFVEHTRASVGVIGGFVGTTGKPALIENVHIQGEIKGGSNCAAFGGQSREGTFRNCSADIKILSGGTDCGGFAGQTNVSTIIENCHAKVDLTPTEVVSGNLRYGGLIGWAKGATLKISDCTTEGVIRNDKNSVKTSAGICSYVGTDEAEIVRCHSNVSFEGGKIQNSGGIVGIASPAVSLLIKDCYSSGTAEVHQVFGGILGRQEKATITVENCYSTIDINGYSGLGGLFGSKTSSGTPLVFTNCFAWNSSIKASRESADKFSSGAVAGSASKDSNTFTGCYRTPSMTFSDAFRTLQDHADLANGTPEGDNNQNAYDGRVCEESSLSAAAQKAGWSAEVWNFSGDMPVLK